jgi:hypothetical protein
MLTMNNAACENTLDYADPSCGGAKTATDVASPVIRVGMILIVIIILVVVGFAVKKYVSKLRATAGTPIDAAIEKSEQDKLLNQKLE